MHRFHPSIYSSKSKLVLQLPFQCLLELVNRAPPVFGLMLELITLLFKSLAVLGRGALLHRSHPSKIYSSKSSLLVQELVQDISSSSSSNPNLSSPKQ